MAPTKHSIHNCTFTMATSTKGGAIYYGISGAFDIGKKSVSPTSGVLTGLHFDSCYATEAAGAIYFDSVEVQVVNSNFVNCSSGHFGGAILANAGLLNMSASHFEDCSVEAEIETEKCFHLLLTSTAGTRGWNGNVLYMLESRWADVIVNEFDPTSTCDLQTDDLEFGGCGHMNVHERIGTDFIKRFASDGEADVCFTRGDGNNSKLVSQGGARGATYVHAEEFIIFVTKGLLDFDATWILTDQNQSTTYYTGKIKISVKR